MKLTRIETIHLAEHATLLFVRLHTDAGLIGHGETKYAPRALEGFIHDYMAPLLLGTDPLRIDHHWRTLYDASSRCGNKGVEMRAISAADIALWDIFGQATDMPIYQLLGGASHDRMPVYNTCAGPVYARQLDRSAGVGNAGIYEDLDAFTHRAGELATELLSEGICGMKIWPFDPFAAKTRGQRISVEDIDLAIEPFRQIRDAVGNRIEIMVEGHGLWSFPAACRIADAVEQFQPFWIEDLVRPDDLGTLVELRTRTRTPMLVCEMLQTRYEYKPVFEARAADIVMVDPAWTGGISESRKIAQMAETYNLPVTFHDCAGPINLFAGLHLALNAPNAIYQEIVRAFIRTFYDDLVTSNISIEDGFAALPCGSGLGTTLRPEVVERADATVLISETD
jgi:galactonate dehydratase